MNLARLVLIPSFILLTLAISACGDSRSTIHERPIYGSTAPPARQSTLVPGRGHDIAATDPETEPTEAVLVEGKRLYNWYNCSGCHFNGGGGIGPPLMGERFIYGREPEVVADSIINGRPQGMPAYGDRIPPSHVMPIVAYVRSLSRDAEGIEPPMPPEPYKVTEVERDTEPAQITPQDQ